MKIKNFRNFYYFSPSRKRISLANSPSLKLVEGVDLLAHLGDSIVVLLAQNSQRGLMLNVGLLEISAELAQLGLALLVQLDLTGSGTASLLHVFAEFLELASKIAALLLGLGSSAAFCLDLEEENGQTLLYTSIVAMIVIYKSSYKRQQ